MKFFKQSKESICYIVHIPKKTIVDIKNNETLKKEYKVLLDNLRRQIRNATLLFGGGFAGEYPENSVAIFSSKEEIQNYLGDKEIPLECIYIITVNKGKKEVIDSVQYNKNKGWVKKINSISEGKEFDFGVNNFLRECSTNCVRKITTGP